MSCTSTLQGKHLCQISWELVKNWGSSSRRKIGDRPPDRRHADSYIPPLYTTCMRGYNNTSQSCSFSCSYNMSCHAHDTTAHVFRHVFDEAPVRVWMEEVQGCTGLQEAPGRSAPKWWHPPLFLSPHIILRSRTARSVRKIKLHTFFFTRKNILRSMCFGHALICFKIKDENVASRTFSCQFQLRQIIFSHFAHDILS